MCCSIASDVFSNEPRLWLIYREWIVFSVSVPASIIILGFSVTKGVSAYLLVPKYTAIHS